MSKSFLTLLAVAIALVASLTTASLVRHNALTTQVAKESAYDRVMRTHTLRCGYVVYESALMKDPNTGVFSGIIYDITELLGKRAGLKIEWAEEVSFGSMIEGLKTGRYDALCINGWNSGGYSAFLSQTIPLYYSALDAYTWKGNNRFDHNLGAINDPSVKISAIDGTATKVIADQNFPNATQLTMPQTTDYITALVNVAEKKADVTFIERHAASMFMGKNPDKIQRVIKDTPIRYYANGLQMDIGENKLLAMFNMTLEEMLGSGDIDVILDRYRKDDPSSFLPVAKPFIE